MEFQLRGWKAGINPSDLSEIQLGVTLEHANAANVANAAYINLGGSNVS